MLVWLPRVDRYPETYVDEPFYNLPAVNFLRTGQFQAELLQGMPFQEELYAFSGPIYPRLQIYLHGILGIGHAAARLPSLIAFRLALIGLAIFLIGRGLPLSALLICMFLVGDSVELAMLFGRMEGIALLTLVGGFVTWVRFVESPGWLRGATLGTVFGIAGAVHPTIYLFAMIVGVAALVCIPMKRWSSMVGVIGCGALVTSLIWLLFWWPRWGDSLEQFRWAISNQSNQYLKGTWSSLTRLLGYSLPFALTRYALSWACLGLLGWAVFRRWRRDQMELSRVEAVWLAAMAFAVAGAVHLLNVPKHRHYIPYHAPWAILAVLVMSEAGNRLGLNRSLRVASRLLLVLLAVTWTPSVFWNATRMREAIRDYHALDPLTSIERLRKALPESAELIGSSYLYVELEQSGRKYDLLSLEPQNEFVSENIWILLHPFDNKPETLSDKTLQSHPRLFRLDLTPDALSGPRPVYIRPPLTATPQEMQNLNEAGAVEENQ